MYEPIERTRAREASLLLSASSRLRLLESLPGIISWTLLLSPIWLTLINPVAGSILAALSIAYFVLRTSSFGIGALFTRRRLLSATQVDWLSRLQARSGWKDYRCIFLIRAFREGNLPLLQATLDSIYESSWPKPSGRLHNVEVVFATEANDTITPPMVEKLSDIFAGRMSVRQIVHPVERWVLPGPSSAMHYAGQIMYDDARRQGLDPDRIMVIDLDADTLFHPQYLPCLMYHHVTRDRRIHHVYQPIVLFTNDYWHAPLHSRLAALGTSVLTLGWNTGPEIAFSGAATTLSLLATVDFWPTQSHSQDSGVELRLKMKYRRGFAVTGLPVPVGVYPVMELGKGSSFMGRLRSYWTSFRVLFRQSARWREGPLDEFVEAASQGDLYHTLAKLWRGVERDTLTPFPALGVLAVQWISQSVYSTAPIQSLQTISAIALTLMSFLGLFVFWQILSVPEIVRSPASPWRKVRDIVLFYLVMPLYVPIITASAGLKTSTAYALGKRPTGHYIPTPK